MRGHKLLAVVAVVVGVTVPVAEASAGGLNDWSCVPAAEHPNPVVLVHGRGGDVNGFDALVTALDGAGFCVYGVHFGQVGGQGQYGVDHLWVMGEQIDAFIQVVLASTGASQVDLISHSAGTGVIANFLLARGGAPQVRRAVSFAGLHHPYAHAGAAGFLDNDLFLPNLIKAARLIDPDITAQQVIVAAIGLYAGVGGSLAGIDVETATSNFASDLFDPVYWAELHGGLSESPTTFIKLATSGRSLRTGDAAPDVCYTNIVGVADALAGATAGFQDEAPNVENVLLVSGADHAQILADPVAVTRALVALATPCTPPGGAGDGTDRPEDGDGEGDDEGDDGDDGAGADPGDAGQLAGGCVTVSAPARPSLAGLVLVLAVLASLVMRRRA